MPALLRESEAITSPWCVRMPRQYVTIGSPRCGLAALGLMRFYHKSPTRDAAGPPGYAFLKPTNERAPAMTQTAADPFADYALGAAYDEAFAAPDAPRSHYETLRRQMATLGPDFCRRVKAMT